MKKWVFSIFVFSIALAIMAFFGFFLAIFLVGPHSDILPEFLKSPVFLLILLIVPAVPGWLAFKVFQTLNVKNLS